MTIRHQEMAEDEQKINDLQYRLIKSQNLMVSECYQEKETSDKHARVVGGL